MMKYHFNFSKREWQALTFACLLAIAPIFFMVYETLGTKPQRTAPKSCKAAAKKVKPICAMALRR